jgi:hypothetical protein
MKKLAIVLLLLSSSALFAAVPFVGECDFVQDADSGVASVSFTLAEDAVVTFDVLTNGVSIGWRNFRSGISGCKLGEVNPAGDYELKWDVYGSWGVKQLPIRAGGIKAVVTAWSPDNPPQYMDVDLTRDGGIVYYIDEADLPHPVTSSVYKTTHLLLKRIYAGNK